MKENFSDRQHYLNQKNCFEVMLANGVIPVVNENDTVSVTELMFTDNDELSGLIAAMMSVDRLIILSNIDGIYDGDPSEASSSVIKEILPGEDIGRHIRKSKSVWLSSIVLPATKNTSIRRSISSTSAVVPKGERSEFTARTIRIISPL